MSFRAELAAPRVYSPHHCPYRPAPGKQGWFASLSTFFEPRSSDWECAQDLPKNEIPPGTHRKGHRVWADFPRQLMSACRVSPLLDGDSSYRTEQAPTRLARYAAEYGHTYRLQYNTYTHPCRLTARWTSDCVQLWRQGWLEWGG